jgi:hypothetical protein
MALKFTKKIVFARISAKVESELADALDQFTSFVVKREGADHITKDVVIQEILRDYLGGISADVRQWREYEASELAKDKARELATPAPQPKARPASGDTTQAGVKDLNDQVDQALNLGKEDAVKPVLAVGRERLEAEQQRIKNNQENKPQASEATSSPAPGASAS